MYLLLACAPILALLLGCVACRSILGPLKRVVRMAKELSEGNIESRLNLTQKDEIGALAGAMDQLADVLSRLVRQVQESSAKVANGYLRDKVPSEGLKGCFRELVESLNLLVGKVVLMLDSLPTPVMVRDAERRIRFLNKAGGLDLVDVERIHGGLCADHFKTEDCTNGNCACDKAFKTHQKEVSSTVANPTPGVSMDVAYSAIPFGDDSVIEFIIDQSAIQGAQRKLLKTASAAQEVVDVVTSASEELSAQVEQSSRGAEEQSRRIGDTARAMEQMNATVLQVAKNSSESARFADDARRKAQDGNSIVMEVVSSIQLVQQIALRLNEDMDALGRQAAGIGQVVNVISDIADQTNLLALNAAIEAARAGDAGRGFAVVADEVRKLAEKTQTATKEVDASISSMQQGTRQNIANVEEAVKTIEIANRQANASGEALQVIVNLIESASDQVRSIATASEQQSASSEEISQSVENVATISSETADAMRQSAQAVSELAHQAVILRSLIVDMQSNGNRSGEAGPGAREIHGSRKLALVR
jgi:methyl-accepting chemotaxis protein